MKNVHSISLNFYINSLVTQLVGIIRCSSNKTFKVQKSPFPQHYQIIKKKERKKKSIYQKPKNRYKIDNEIHFK
jgi:hypothetical protein